MELGCQMALTRRHFSLYSQLVEEVVSMEGLIEAQTDGDLSLFYTQAPLETLIC